MSSSIDTWNDLWSIYDGFGSGNSSFGSYWSNINDRPAFFVVDGTSGIQYNTDSVLNREQWYHLVFVYDSTGQTAKIYVDDTEDFSATRTVGCNASTEPYTVGYQQHGHTLGEIGFSYVYDRALSSSEVTEMYNGGSPKCWDSMSPGLKVNCIVFQELANWPGHSGGELTDRSGNGNNATNTGNASFTGSGLNVEC